MCVGTLPLLLRFALWNCDPLLKLFRSSVGRGLLCGQAVPDEVDDEKAAQAFINPTTAAGGMPLQLPLPKQKMHLGRDR